MNISLGQMWSRLLPLGFFIAIGGYSPLASADPETIAASTDELIKGTELQVAKVVNGFYMAKARGYYSYVYLIMSKGHYKGLFEYKESGKINKGYFEGKYHSQSGWGIGKICYENTNEWLAHGGIIFNEEADKPTLRLLYTETDDPTDKSWKNDWDHQKNEEHSKVNEFKTRYEKATISCDVSKPPPDTRKS